MRGKTNRGQVTIDFIFVVVVLLAVFSGLKEVALQMEKVQQESTLRFQLKRVAEDFAWAAASVNILYDPDIGSQGTLSYSLASIRTAQQYAPLPCTVDWRTFPEKVVATVNVNGKAYSEEAPWVIPPGLNTNPLTPTCGETVSLTVG